MSKSVKILYALFAIISLYIWLTAQNCIMRGQVSQNETKYYNGSGLPVANRSIAAFQKLCSSLLPPNYEESQPIYSCCDSDQLDIFNQGIASLEQIIPTCGICRENIQRLTCNIICHRNQSDFTVAHVENGTNIVKELEVAISYKFAHGLFDSCKDVLFPNSNVRVISFICNLGGIKCDPRTFITSLLSNSQFKIRPKIYDTNETIPTKFKYAVDPKSHPCNESYAAYTGVMRECGCQDCFSSCLPPPVIPNDDSIYFNHLKMYEMAVICLYIVFLIAFIASFVAQYVKYRGESPSLYIEQSLEELIVSDTISLSNQDEQSLLPLDGIRGNEFQQKMHNIMQRLLKRWGHLVATNKIIFSFFPILIAVGLASGIAYRFEVTSDPIDIWSPPNSEFRKQKAFFDSNFGPFYRTQQIIIKTPNISYTNSQISGFNTTFGPPLRKEIIQELFKIQAKIENLAANFVERNKTKTVTLKDICFKPSEPHNDYCAMFSITQYFQNNPTRFNTTFDGNDWHVHLFNCINRPESMSDDDFGSSSCFSDFSAPINPKLVLAGYDKDANEATMLVITYIVNNYNDLELNRPAMAWEATLLAYLKSYKHSQIEISFSSERSIQDEIDRQSHAEIFTVSISYLVMFIYVALSLGKFSRNNFYTFFVKQKVVLGFAGVFLVFSSVLSSIGLFCYFGFKVNMIVLEVLPFLILAVGVDNIFLMVHEYRRIQAISGEDSLVYPMIGQMMANVGHGMIVSAAAQVTTFSIGAISNIPAVKSFSLFAAVALAINFFLQMTLFLVIFSLDCIREQSKRPDILCFLHFPSAEEDEFSVSISEKCFDLLSRVTLAKYAKPIIIFVFITGWFASLYVVPSVKVGLDQTTALPTDSYLQTYFKDVFKHLKSGPPAYFMVYSGYSYEDSKHQELICSRSDCSPDSLTTTIYQYSRIPSYSKIATPANSWLDTYLAWLKPNEQTTCCRFKIDNSTNKKIFCPSYSSEHDIDCKPCFPSNDLFIPTKKQFADHLPWFLVDIPVESCALGGKPSYGRSVVLNPQYYDQNDSSALPVLASSFMTYHTSLASSEELISALTVSVSISKKITKTLNHTFVGINVEFLSHIGRGFLFAKSTSRTLKARMALVHTGSSVFSGIAMTKILGVGVLAFSNSVLFRVYYFQMYACAIFIGAIHGLILLPVVLSYLGPVDHTESIETERLLQADVD
ncbi:hypothetical protein MXB_4028 [Myxobolus squamalis]|nr:hypothetical protein MXB_4028 [Myxobolus squamalis]